MKKKELAKIVAIVLAPGGIPIWLGYKLYERIKRSNTNDTKIRAVDKLTVDDDELKD